MSMLRSDIITDCSESIGLLSTDFDSVMDDILNTALLDYSSYKPLQGIGALTLIPNQSVYDAPADLIGFKYHDWGRANRSRRDQWNTTFIRIPDVKLLPGENGQKPYRLFLSSAPSVEGISICGTNFQYFYTASHQVTEDTPGTIAATTVPAEHRHLLILRMFAEICKRLSLKRTGKVSIVDPKTKNSNRSGTPQRLYESFMSEFRMEVTR